MPVSTGHNVQSRVTVKAGWIGVFAGESLGSATERTIADLNRDGYRVAFMVPDQWSVGRKLLNILITACTVNILSYQEGLLIIGERPDDG